MRRLVGGALIVFAAACGSSPSAPAPPAPFSLPDGAYTLLVFSPPGTQCFSFRVGAANPPNPTISVNATVSRDGAGWVIRLDDGSAGSLVIRLSASGAGAAGRAVGTAVAPSGTSMIVLDHSLSGTQTGMRVEGVMSGVVDFITVPPGASTVCDPTAWSLTRR